MTKVVITAITAKEVLVNAPAKAAAPSSLPPSAVHPEITVHIARAWMAYAAATKAAQPRPRACARSCILVSSVIPAILSPSKARDTSATRAQTTTSARSATTAARTTRPMRSKADCSRWITTHFHGSSLWSEVSKAKPSPPEAKPSFSPPRDDVPIAKAVRVEVSSFEKGQLVTLMNMSSNPDMNGTSAVVLNVVGDRVIVEVPSLSNKKITVRPENLQLSYTPFAVGSLVELKDLAKAEMNGLLAVVVEAGAGSDYRLQVKLLDDQNRILRIKPDNLKIVEDFF
ncbi:hypothetical protein MHU86_21612 [Fragilaria crotonensis]|nr:hypothetical protein MHU86_21612 [Fragilaria crotonensis]